MHESVPCPVETRLLPMMFMYSYWHVALLFMIALSKLYDINHFRSLEPIVYASACCTGASGLKPVEVSVSFG